MILPTTVVVTLLNTLHSCAPLQPFVVWCKHLKKSNYFNNILRNCFNPISLKCQFLLLRKCDYVIKKCDYVINETHKWARKRCLGSHTRWLGLLGQGVGVREVHGSIPGGTTHYCSAYFASEKVLGLWAGKDKSIKGWWLHIRANLQR